MTVSENIAISSTSTPSLREKGNASENSSAGSETFSAVFEIVKKSVFDLTVNSGSYDQIKLDLTNEPIGAGTFSLSANGSYLYHLDRSEKIRQYSLEDPWELSSVEFEREVDFSNQADSARGFDIKPDGKKLYIADNNDNDKVVWQYELETAYDISTAKLESNAKIPFEDGSIGDIQFQENGKTIFAQVDVLRSWNLSESWNIETVSNYSNGKYEASKNGFHFGNNGKDLFTADSGTFKEDAFVRQHKTSDWNLNSLSQSTSLNVTSEDTAIQDVFISEDGGYRMYVLGNEFDGPVFYQYSFLEASVEEQISVISTSKTKEVKTYTDPFETVSIGSQSNIIATETSESKEDVVIETTSNPTIADVQEIQSATVSILSDANTSILESGLQLSETAEVNEDVDVQTPDEARVSETVSLSPQTNIFLQDEAITSETVSVNT